MNNQPYFVDLKPVFGLLWALGWLLAACQNTHSDLKTDGHGHSAEDSIYFSNEAYSPLVLDSLQLLHFLDSAEKNASEREPILKFYQKRNFQFAWLDRGMLNPAAQDFYLRYQDFLSDYSDSTLADPVLDSLMYQLASEGFDNPGKHLSEQLEMRLSLSFFRYAKKEFTGLLEDPAALHWYIPKYKKNYAALLDSLAAGRNPGRIKEPANAYYEALKSALAYYKNLEKSGKWPQIPEWSPPSGTSQMDPKADWLKQCLQLTQDLSALDTADSTDALTRALKNFQTRMGLKQTGQLDKATHEQLSIPISGRQRQIMVNLERLRWLPEQVKGDFLLVNIPAFTLYVFRDGKPIWDSKLVVGKEASKTQVFKGKISHIILNPYWAVPPGIIRKEVLPGLKKNPNYLHRHNMKVYSGNTLVDESRINWHNYATKIPYTIRQLPGKDNPLGKIKFLFPNSFWIFLHDSNEPWRFASERRTFSHGCIRVEKAEQLANYLFEKNAGMNTRQIKKAFDGKSEAYYKLKTPEPVYIIYLTSWVDDKGKLHFRPDVYGRDSLLLKAVFGKSGN